MATDLSKIPESSERGGGSLLWYVFNKFSFRGWIGMAVVFGTLGIIVLIFYRPIPTVNERIAFTILGILLGKFGTVVDWNFGGAKVNDDRNKAEIKKSLHDTDEQPQQ